MGLAVSLIEFKWPSLGILGMGGIRSAQDVKYIVRISCSIKTVKNSNFDFPIKKNRQGNFKISSGELVYTCLTSDFFLEDADSWRIDAWKMMKVRHDLKFFIITKSPNRFFVSLPNDWEDRYDNVEIACTVEN